MRAGWRLAAAVVMTILRLMTIQPPKTMSQLVAMVVVEQTEPGAWLVRWPCWLSMVEYGQMLHCYVQFHLISIYPTY